MEFLTIETCKTVCLFSYMCRLYVVNTNTKKTFARRERVGARVEVEFIRVVVPLAEPSVLNWLKQHTRAMSVVLARYL